MGHPSLPSPTLAILALRDLRAELPSKERSIGL